MNTKKLSLNLPIILAKKNEILIFLGLSVVSFALPFSLGHPQWLVGALVNTFLFLATTFLSPKYFISLAVFPSLGVLARGMMFGPLTMFLVYFLPFIWLSNLVLILVFKKISKSNYLVSIFSAAALKYLFLVLIANIYFRFHIVPALFLKTMGINQLITALTGGIIFIIILNIWKIKQKKQENS